MDFFYIAVIKTHNVGTKETAFFETKKIKNKDLYYLCQNFNNQIRREGVNFMLEYLFQPIVMENSLLYVIMLQL